MNAFRSTAAKAVIAGAVLGFGVGSVGVALGLPFWQACAINVVFAWVIGRRLS